MASAKMIPEGLLTVDRGVMNKTIDFQGIPVEVTIKVFTNEEANRLSEEFTELVGGDIEVDIPRMAEERIIRGLIEINTTFNGGQKWSELTNNGKAEALQVLHPELREKIGHEIFGKTHLSREEKDFLRNPSSQDE